MAAPTRTFSSRRSRSSRGGAIGARRGTGGCTPFRCGVQRWLAKRTSAAVLITEQLRDYENLTIEIIGEPRDQTDLQKVRELSEDRRLAIQQLLAEVGRLRSDYTFEL